MSEPRPSDIALPPTVPIDMTALILATLDVVAGTATRLAVPDARS